MRVTRVPAFNSLGASCSSSDCSTINSTFRPVMLARQPETVSEAIAQRNGTGSLILCLGNDVSRTHDPKCRAGAPDNRQDLDWRFALQPAALAILRARTVKADCCKYCAAAPFPVVVSEHAN